MFNEKILFVLFVLLCISLPAQTLKLNGNVSTSTMPVKYASVTFIDESDTDRYFSALTDDLGNYELDIITTIEPVDIFPTEFELAQNYPNPFNPTTTIEYRIPKESYVVLKVYDLLGKEITILVNERKLPGTYKTNFDGNRLTSGVYIATLIQNNSCNSIKLILAK